MTALDRRDFLRTGTLAVLGAAAACGKGGGTATPTPSAAAGSIQAIVGTRTQAFDLFSANAETMPGRPERFAFALLRPGQGTPFSGGSGRVWVAPDRTSQALGPFDAEYHGEGLGDRGVYVSTIEFPKNGGWLVLVEAQPDGQQQGIALAQVAVGPQLAMPRPGDDAVSVATPTFDRHRGVDPICTRKPKPCSMHAISLDDALRNGKPTVLTLGTPAFCQSRLCGPELEIIDGVARDVGKRANFVHIEVYKNDDPETVAKQILAPAAAEWKLSTEPVTYWIEPDGTIRERYIGPVDVGDIRDATLELVR